MSSSTISRKGIRSAIIVLLLVAFGTAVYYMLKRRDVVRQKEEIGAIHEREVQKAIRELTTEKLAKKVSEERVKLLTARRAELQSLNKQLRQIMSAKAAALNELDDIRRPRLFRSRAKKQAQLSKQLQIIDRLDVRALGLRNSINACQTAVDTLSVYERR